MSRVDHGGHTEGECGRKAYIEPEQPQGGSVGDDLRPRVTSASMHDAGLYAAAERRKQDMTSMAHAATPLPAGPSVRATTMPVTIATM